MRNKFKVGQKLICFHYKDMPTVTVSDHRKKLNQVWVYETKKSGEEKHWWGPAEWFKASARLKKRKIAKKVNKILAEHRTNRKALLCDSKVPGCSCNQAASVGC